MSTPFTARRLTLWRYLVCLCLLCLPGLLSSSAHAQSFEVGVVFTPDTMTAMPGDTVNYTATFTNNTATDLAINGASFNSTDPNFFTTDGNFGLFNGTGIGDGSFELAANSSLTVTDVVSLLLDPATPNGTFPIDVTFTGRDFIEVGNPLVSDRDLGTGSLSVTIVTPVPEPGVFWTMGGLMLAGGANLGRRRRQSVPC